MLYGLSLGPRVPIKVVDAYGHGCLHLSVAHLFFKTVVTLNATKPTPGTIFFWDVTLGDEKKKKK